MSLIFDRFPTRHDAELFAAAVERTFGLAAVIFDDNAAAMEHDPFPLRLEPPIVHVDRPDDEDVKVERLVTYMVRTYRGTFAGT